MTRRRKSAKVQTTRKNLYKHNLIVNSYINTAFKAMMKDASRQAKMEYLYYLIRYCFRNISLQKSHELTQLLYQAILDCKSDQEILVAMFTFYKGLLATDFLPSLFTSEEYSQAKLAEIEETLTPALLKMKRGTLLLDVGSGDCSLVKLVADARNMQPVGVDLKDDIEWGKGSSMCKQITHILYNGRDLAKAVRAKVGTKQVGLIMYNHALHHFGSPDAIKHSLQEAYKLLPKTGLLFLREHDVSQTTDIDINLQHIFIHMRHVIDQHKMWDADDLWAYMNHHMRTFSAHFFTKDSLLRLVKSIGFRLIKVQSKVPMPYANYREISTTTFFAFEKN